MGVASKTEPTFVDQNLDNAVAVANETNAFSPDSTRQGAITSNDLSDEVDFELGGPPPETETVGFEGEIDAMLEADQRRSEQAATAAQTEQKESLDDLTSFLIDTPGETERTVRAENQAGVPEIQRELDDINDQMRREKNRLRRQVESIQSQPGLTAAQADARVSEVRRKSLSTQADLAIIQQSVQGRFDSAQTLASRKVAIEMERDDRLFQALTLNYQNNKDLFDKKEQRAFEARQTRIKNGIESRRDTLDSIYNLAIEAKKNGASDAATQLILNAKTKGEALSVGGRYLVKPTPASAPKLQNFGSSDSPDWRQYNYKTGQWEEIPGLGSSGLSPQQVNEIDSGVQESQVSIDVIDNMLLNDRGIGAITGQFKNPTVSGLFQGGEAGELGEFDISGLTRFVPLVGNIQGSVQSRNARDSALTDLTFVYNTEGFQEFIGLKQSGLTFGSLTEGERKSIFSAANRLNSAVTVETKPGTDSSTISGYRGTDEELKRDLNLVKKGLKARQDELNAQLTLDNLEKQEIINTP